MRRPRVCLLLESYYPEIGGGETQALALADGLTARGCEVLVITRRSQTRFARTDRIGGVVVHRLAPAGGGQLKKWGLALSAFPRLLGYSRRYDVLLVCGFRILGIPGVVASRLLRRPCLLKAESSGEMSGSFFGPGLARWGVSLSSPFVRTFLAARNRLLRGADGFVTLSREMAAELRAGGVAPEKVHPIPNCVDTAVFRPASPPEKLELRRELGLPLQAPVAVYTGRLVSYKGLPLLLQVWNGVREQHPAAVLVLVGEGGADLGNCEAELRAYAARHRLGENVRFTGPVTRVDRHLRAADLFVFPTETEAFGISLIEAMACGLPSVATAVGGINDIITDGADGLLVPPADGSRLRAAIERLLTDPPLAVCLGQAAQATAVGRFTKDAVTARYLELIERVAAAREPA